MHTRAVARTQLFLIRALQGYQLPSKGQRVHDEASRRAIKKKLTADMMGTLFSVYKTSLGVFNVASLFGYHRLKIQSPHFESLEILLLLVGTWLENKNFEDDRASSDFENCR